MVKRGWPHSELMAMTEAEFQYHLNQAVEYDRLVNEAQQRAIDDAG